MESVIWIKSRLHRRPIIVEIKSEKMEIRVKSFAAEMTETAVKTCYRCGLEFRASADRVCQECRKPRDRERRTVGGALTFRELQIAELVCQAKLNKEIAFELRLAEGTIKEYMNRIFRKLNVKNRTELAMWAVRHLEKAA